MIYFYQQKKKKKKKKKKQDWNDTVFSNHKMAFVQI